MKKTLTILLIVSLVAFAPDKIKVEGSIADWNKHYNKLEMIRKIVDESNMSNPEVKFITRTIDSLEMFFVPQINKQLTDTTKKK